MDEVARRVALMLGTLQMQLMEAHLRIEALTQEIAKRDEEAKRGNPQVVSNPEDKAA